MRSVDPLPVRFFLAKNRDGETDEREYRFEKSRARFVEYRTACGARLGTVVTNRRMASLAGTLAAQLGLPPIVVDVAGSTRGVRA